VGHGLVVGKGIGPNYPGRGKDVSRFSRPDDEAKKTIKFWWLIFWILPSAGPLGVITVTGHVISTLGCRRFSTVITVPFLGQ
jgi:hypothetical protein